jgi:hypothetical protein
MIEEPDEREMTDDPSIYELRQAVDELRRAVSYVRNQRGGWEMPQDQINLPSDSSGWNFATFEKYIDRRFTDIALQLRERYEAQQTGVTNALNAAEKAVNAALNASEKAVDKAEGAQQLRNEAQNEFRKSLSDLSGLMWTTKEGTSTVESLRRELSIVQDSLATRLNVVERDHANIQGRIWAVSALFAIAALILDVGSRFISVH